MTTELALNDLGCYISYITFTMAMMAVIKISSGYKTEKARNYYPK